MADPKGRDAVTALCRGKPADWWETGDGGNRLALTICRACPARPRCAAAARDECGVVRAGIAYSDTGKVLPVCHCGYPQTSYRGGTVTCCPWCTGQKPAPAARREPGRGRDAGHVDEVAVERLISGDPPAKVRLADKRAAMLAMHRAGADLGAIASRLKVQVRAVEQAIYRAGVTARERGRP